MFFQDKVNLIDLIERGLYIYENPSYKRVNGWFPQASNVMMIKQCSSNYTNHWGKIPIHPEAAVESLY